ncbi:dnaJ homolog subfamily B member 14-like [Tubulanus polymorphus]|uniref:dnaJ homolog subfamily B member 14-like n=1 Tax=Tubulanus polymorphus TaxID=672921 RepID=UPI003DA5FC54
MDGNKDDSEKCINIAIKAINTGDIERALKFLNKAEKLYPSNRAKELLERLQHKQTNGDATSDADSPTSENGPRQRQPFSSSSRQNSSSSVNSEQQRDSAKTESTAAKDYTPEQLEAVKRVKRCKDYYQILGVGRDTSENDLKKAYRKLALQMHPDKNKAPGATEAFKAIGNAFAVLNDPEKKQRYDLYGEESTQSNNMRRRGSHTDGYEYYDYTRGGFEADISAEELFNMFFGGGFGSTNLYRHSRQRRHNPQQSQQREESGYILLVQLAPIIILVLLSFMGSWLVGDPAFSLQKTSKYTIARQTSDLHITYYVQPDFTSQYKGSIYKIDRQVEEEYVSNLRQNCFRERNYKETLIWRARNYNDRKMYERAQNMKTPNCDALERLYS